MKFSAPVVIISAITSCNGLPLPSLTDLNLFDHYNHFQSSNEHLNYFKETIKSLFVLSDGNYEDKSVYISDNIISRFNLNDTKSLDFESWITSQNDIAFNGILANVGGIGSNLDDVADGAVIASPSRSNPDYFYQWTRDAAITIGSLVEYLDDYYNSDDHSNLNSTLNIQLFHAIESYIANSHALQRIDNLSGTWKSLDGLGEPKFMPDNTPYNEHWGRPQRDGPGLRIITISNYLNFMLQNNLSLSNSKLKSFEFIYNEILKPDLNYIVLNWNKNGFDLWEEIDSMHLFTSLTMLKAVKMGIQFSKQWNDGNFTKILQRTFTDLRFFILIESGFKNPDLPYLIETPSLVFEAKRCGLDIGSILGSLRSHDLDNPTDLVDIPFSVDDSAVLSTLAALITDMKFRYPINHQTDFNKGFALGRYPEDLYDGNGISEGNPWFISTATASELLFKLVYFLYYHNKDLVITKDQYPFFATIINIDSKASSEKTIFPYGSQAFIETTLSLMKYADSFLQVIQTHVDEFGNMSEQFNKYTGYMEGAEKLTWSFGSFWSAVRWRNKAESVVKL